MLFSRIFTFFKVDNKFDDILFTLPQSQSGHFIFTNNKKYYFHGFFFFATGCNNIIFWLVSCRHHPPHNHTFCPDIWMSSQPWPAGGGSTAHTPSSWGPPWACGRGSLWWWAGGCVAPVLASCHRCLYPCPILTCPSSCWGWIVKLRYHFPLHWWLRF